MTEMECGCQDDYCDWDNPEAYKVLYRKARKEHVCCECLRSIKKGERYQYISGVWEGGPASYKTCRQCAAIRDDYFCGCGYLTGLRNNVWDHLGVDIITGEVAELEDEKVDTIP